ncbi:MAG: MATE family efflux transporter [Okeania sp. SIO3I5]|uniref:MATE family efflux transporter n=1 Tax=Okeania sp. SIO3I5 TaxID=2607805 RepID=UPI0013B9FA04|nr:MATE family efflux transporter [Okeania sp. SIO3I5]NEQ35786.1 MATE family efflux transporter [Okeania sp. SIO3I5]
MASKRIKEKNQLPSEEIEFALSNLGSQSIGNNNLNQHNLPENFRPRFLQFTIVNILSDIIVPLAGLVDTTFLGHLPNIHHLAGVSLASVIFNYLYWSCLFLYVGTTGLTAQASGRGDRHQVVLVLLRNCLIALLLGVLILLLQNSLQNIGFHLLAGTPEVKTLGQKYFQGRIWDAPPTLMNMVLMGWFVAQQQESKILAMSLVAGGTNIFFDYLLIVNWGWGSFGAGIATAASQYLTLVVGIIFLPWENLRALIPKIYQQIFRMQELKSSFQIKGNFFIATVISILTYVILINLSATFGTLILLSNSLIFQVVNMSTNILGGLASTTQVLVGNYYGAGVNQKLLPVLKFSFLISFSLVVPIGSIFILFPEQLFGVLTNNAEVISVVSNQVFWLLPLLACMSIAHVLDGYFNGLNNSLVVLRSRAVSLVGFLLVAFIAWQLNSSALLWLAFLLFIATRAIILGIKVLLTTKNLELEKI